MFHFDLHLGLRLRFLLRFVLRFVPGNCLDFFNFLELRRYGNWFGFFFNFSQIFLLNIISLSILLAFFGRFLFLLRLLLLRLLWFFRNKNIFAFLFEFSLFTGFGLLNILVHEVHPETAFVKANNIIAELVFIKNFLKVLVGLVLSTGDGPDAPGEFPDHRSFPLPVPVFDDSIKLVHLPGAPNDTSFFNLADSLVFVFGLGGFLLNSVEEFGDVLFFDISLGLNLDDII